MRGLLWVESMMFAQRRRASSVEAPMTPPNWATSNSGEGADWLACVMRDVRMPVRSLVPISARAIGRNWVTAEALLTLGMGYIALWR